VPTGGRPLRRFLTTSMPREPVLADRIPGARKVTVPGVGHLVNMEAPQTVNALLREVVLTNSLA